MAETVDDLERQILNVDREIDALDRLLSYKKPGGVNFDASERRERSKAEQKRNALERIRKNLLVRLKVAEKKKPASGKDFPRMGSR